MSENSNIIRLHAIRTKSCFSLVEIMVVVLIIGMIMGLVGPSIIGQLKKAQRNNAKSQIELLVNAVEAYYLDITDYPQKLEDLVSNPGNEKWDGPYLTKKEVPVDPWGNEYQYDCPGQNGDFDIVSYGADGSPGGSGKDADINSWE